MKKFFLIPVRAQAKAAPVQQPIGIDGQARYRDLPSARPETNVLLNPS